MFSLSKWSILLWLVPACGVSQDEPFRGFAPDDAYLEGSEFPYFGSENPWDRRFFTEHIDRLVKRRGQRQMLDIVEGKAAEAARYCQELLAVDPRDQESLFNLAVAQTQLGQFEAAMGTVRKAEAAGLPFQRFLAGPRHLLKPLFEHEPFREEVTRRDIRLIHGPMLGSVTDSSARVWVRTAKQSAVQVLVRSPGQFKPELRSNVEDTKAGEDYTVVVEVRGMRPDTSYQYDLTIDGTPVLGPEYPAFRTYPPEGSPGQFRIGFGGGAGFVPAHERMWDVIRSHHPSAFLFLGDNVYIDLPEHPNGVHYYTYYRRQSRPEFRRLVASASIYAIWDDHDCATDDVWMGPYKDKPAWKLPLWRQFRENWNNPGYGDPEWPGVWFEFSIGDVDFFMLDGRFYRTNPYAKPATMLGDVQKRWLFKQLRRSKARFKVLLSPVPWAYESKGDAVDTWNGFRRERTEIFDFLAENRIEGVILVSADRHRSDAWRIDRANGYPLYEFESSRLTNEAIHKLMPEALFGYNKKQSFGLLSFDTRIPDPTVTYQIVSIDNEVVAELTLNRSQLTHPEKPEQ